MRTREEIQADLDEVTIETEQQLKIEILLDIKDLLIHLVNATKINKE